MKCQCACGHCWAGASMFSPCFSCFQPVGVLTPCVCASTCRVAAAFCYGLRSWFPWFFSGLTRWLCFPQLLLDLSEYVNLTSPVAPALPRTQWQPPKPPPVSAKATSAGQLDSHLADQLGRPVRTCIASSVGLITNGGGNRSCLSSYTHVIGCLYSFSI